MLIEVQCNKFIKNGQVREPIRFHAGLNAVLGDDNGSNSIGKSTFLMILDFVFGGSDYVKKCTDVQENVQSHTINFAFEFDGQKYYFSRNTTDYNKVVPCDAEYKPADNRSPLSVQQYWEFLCEHYGLTAEGITWRSAVGRFIRVYKRDTLDEERPLRSSKDEKTADAIKNYMRLFDRYAAVEAQIKQAAEAEDEKEAFRKTTQTYNHVRAAKNEKERTENEERIIVLEQSERELAESSNQGLLDLDSMTARRLTELTERLINYRRQKARVQTQLNAIRRDMTEQKKGFKRTFTDLERFFPGEEFRTLEDIERFHQKLAKVLADEFAETEKDLATTFVLLNNEIVRIQEQITEIKNVPNVSQAILREFARITTELNNLREANQNYDELERLKKVAADYAETRDAVIHDQLLAIEFAVNQAMREISFIVLVPGNVYNVHVIALVDKVKQDVFENRHLHRVAPSFAIKKGAHRSVRPKNTLLRLLRHKFSTFMGIRKQGECVFAEIAKTYSHKRSINMYLCRKTILSRNGAFCNTSFMLIHMFNHEQLR